MKPLVVKVVLGQRDSEFLLINPNVEEVKVGMFVLYSLFEELNGMNLVTLIETHHNDDEIEQITYWNFTKMCVITENRIKKYK